MTNGPRLHCGCKVQLETQFLGKDTPSPVVGMSIVYCARHSAGEQVLISLKLVREGVMAHHSGGDSAMVFDEFDYEAERKRKGWYSVDDRAIDLLDSTIRLLEAIDR